MLINLSFFFFLIGKNEIHLGTYLLLIEPTFWVLALPKIASGISKLRMALFGLGINIKFNLTSDSNFNFATAKCHQIFCALLTFNELSRNKAHHALHWQIKLLFI